MRDVAHEVRVVPSGRCRIKHAVAWEQSGIRVGNEGIIVPMGDLGLRVKAVRRRVGNVQRLWSGPRESDITPIKTLESDHPLLET